MKFIVSSATLSSHLQTIGRVINTKNTLPILDCFLFDLVGEVLTVTASDTETRLSTQLPVNETTGDVRFAIS
ncbi:MAG: DNA polymerase III subunit beta, partial [Bacteroidaceae bacterium]